MIRAARRLLTGWRFRKMTRHFDAAIKEARRKHRPVKHLQQAKADFVHSCLRGGA